MQQAAMTSCNPNKIAFNKDNKNNDNNGVNINDNLSLEAICYLAPFAVN